MVIRLPSPNEGVNGLTYMGSFRHKQIMSHAEVQFGPHWIALRDRHKRELREAQFSARQTNNSAAMLPAEAACYVAHTKALVVARANCVAEAYTTLNEPAGSEAEAELSTFFATTVAARKASFQGDAELRRIRTGNPATQLGGLLRSFEREANPALVEGRAILDKQRATMINKTQIAALTTKYVVDTSVFNWLADGRIKREALPSDGGFAITHVQVDEINHTRDQERRARLALMQASLRCELLPTQTFLLDISRLDHARFGDGKLFMSIKAELDSLNRAKKNNNRDALIAETAVANGFTLLTADGNLRSVTEAHGGIVIFFPPPFRSSQRSRTS